VKFLNPDFVQPDFVAGGGEIRQVNRRQFRLIIEASIHNFLPVQRVYHNSVCRFYWIKNPVLSKTYLACERIIFYDNFLPLHGNKNYISNDKRSGNAFNEAVF
jgi:hypothetical protein